MHAQVKADTGLNFDAGGPPPGGQASHVYRNINVYKTCDSGRLPACRQVFTRNKYKNILVENLKYCQNQKGLEIFAWCIMTNHIHLVIRAKDGFSLPDILRDFKKCTSKAVLKTIAGNNHESRKDWLLIPIVL